MARLSSFWKAYLGLFALVAVLRIILSFVPVDYVLPSQEQMVSIPGILLVFALGLIGLHLTPRAGFAEMWDASVANQERSLISILIGFGFGILSVLLDLPQPLDTSIQIKMPASLLVHPIEGVLEEILFRFLPAKFSTPPTAGQTLVLYGPSQPLSVMFGHRSLT